MVTAGAFPGGALAVRASLGTALAMTLLNQFWLEPVSTKIMFARYDMENSKDEDLKESAEYKKLASSFGKFHGISSLTNLIAVCAAFVHAYNVASSIVAAV